MDEELKNKLLELDYVKDIAYQGNYVLIKIKSGWLTININNVVRILDFMDNNGYILLSELGIDVNKFIFRKVGEK